MKSILSFFSFLLAFQGGTVNSLQISPNNQDWVVSADDLSEFEEFQILKKIIETKSRNAGESCQIQIVESIPEGLVYNQTEPKHLPTYQAWLELLSLLNSDLELASSYWSLRGSDVFKHPSAWQGEDIFGRLSDVASQGQVKIKIAQNLPDPNQPNLDTEELSKFNLVEVKSLNFSALMGSGILHTKLWIVDRTHFYVGSANFDWRSLTQVKEMGVLVKHCPALAKDMAKIFDVYWALGGNVSTIPDKWPEYLSTKIDAMNPLVLFNTLDQTRVTTYLSSSPAPFCPSGRSVDIDAILRHIDEAEEFVDIAVMDYFPMTLYEKNVQFWPDIDNKLRKAAIERKVRVRLLVSDWDHSRPSIKNFLRSLSSLNNIDGKVSVEGKLFKVPIFSPDQAEIPFARVNHNKYMVTDKVAYIGTSNWSADYFLSTGGIGIIFGSMNSTNDFREQLKNVFQRDWNSEYAQQN